jgi:hypothetical protein
MWTPRSKTMKPPSRRPPLIQLNSLNKFGAGEGIRTLDPNLGKRVPLHIKGLQSFSLITESP